MKIQQDQIDLAQKLVDTAEKMHAAGYMAAPELYSRREGLLRRKTGAEPAQAAPVARDTELAETRSALDQRRRNGPAGCNPCKASWPSSIGAAPRPGAPVLRRSRADRRARRQHSPRLDKWPIRDGRFLTFFRSKARSRRQARADPRHRIRASRPEGAPPL